MIKQDQTAARRALQPRNRRLIRRSGRKLKHAITALAAVVLLGMLLLLGSVSIEQRDASEERAWNDAANLSGAFEEQIGRVLDSVSGAISLLKPGLTANGATFSFNDLTRNLPEFATSTFQIAFVGPDGELLASSLTDKPKPIDLSDREHIRVHLKGDHKGLYIGKPVLGRVSGQPTIQVTSKVETADGKLAGVIVFSLSPEFLTTLHRVVNLGKTGSMILAGDDGAVRASYGAWQNSDYDYLGASISGTKAMLELADAARGLLSRR